MHAVRGHDFGGSPFDLEAILALPIITSLFVWQMLYRHYRSRRGTVALWMLLGVWLFGPLCTTFGATFSGGGFTTWAGWLTLLLGIPLFIPLTFMSSTYDGTLGALAVVTVFFAIAGAVSLLRKRPLTPDQPKAMP
jgi:Na+-driven multidrug efflux pump